MQLPYAGPSARLLPLVLLLRAASPSSVPPPPLVATAGLPPWPSDCSDGPTYLGCYHDHDPTFGKKEFVGPRLVKVLVCL
jgi:hypothetical protein